MWKQKQKQKTKWETLVKWFVVFVCVCVWADKSPVEHLINLQCAQVERESKFPHSPKSSFLTLTHWRPRLLPALCAHNWFDCRLTKFEKSFPKPLSRMRSIIIMGLNRLQSKRGDNDFAARVRHQFKLTRQCSVVFLSVTCKDQQINERWSKFACNMLHSQPHTNNEQLPARVATEVVKTGVREWT